MKKNYFKWEKYQKEHTVCKKPGENNDDKFYENHNIYINQGTAASTKVAEVKYIIFYFKALTLF